MEEKPKKISISIDEYTKRIEKKLIEANSLEEVQTIKSKVVPKYIEAYNNKKLKGSDLAKLSSLISEIETKEKELELFEIAEENVKLMKEYAEHVNEMKKAYIALNKKKGE